MNEIDDDGTMAPLGSIIDGARQFGLTDAEVLAIVDDCVYEIGTEATVTELLEELTAAFARGIVAKQRRVLSDASAAPEQRRTRSRDPR